MAMFSLYYDNREPSHISAQHSRQSISFVMEKKGLFSLQFQVTVHACGEVNAGVQSS